MKSSVGKRIVVIGVSAVGKSTFARLLGEKLHIPTTSMDAIMWKPGWEYIGDEKTEEALREIAQLREWIIEGYIVTASRTNLFELADTIIYLDFNPFVASWRYVRRWLQHRKYPRPELPGSPERFNFEFLKLVWSKGEAESLGGYLKQASSGKKLIVLKSPREAKYFLDSIL